MNRNAKSGHVGPATVEKFLAGMHYPANKEKLVKNAEGRDAPKDVIDSINKLPDKCARIQVFVFFVA